MVGTAKTVLGPVSASQLGITHTHAHLLLTFSAAKEDMPDLYDIEALAGPLIDDLGKAVRQYKIKTLVDAAPEALGRDVDLWQLVARQLNINVIAATGFYRQRGGVAGYWGYQEEDQYEEFILRELTEGVGPNKVQCGVIKIAWTGEPPGDPEPVELKATRAAARASRRTGAPVVAHCSFRADSNRNLGLEQVKMLMENGADPSRVEIDHCMGANANLPYLIDIAKSGAYVSIDSLVDNQEAYRGVKGDIFAASVGGLIRAGYGDRILIGIDTVGVWFPKIPPGPAKDWINLDHGFVHRELLPKLRSGGIKERDLEKILIENPARLYAW